MFSQFRRSNHMIGTGVALALCLSAASAHAVWQWMRGAALTDFKESDWTLLQQTAALVLNEKPDHEQVNWANPDTGNKGSIIALATFQFEGKKCRRAAMRNITFHGRDDRATYTLCQQADGDWIFVPESTIRASTAGAAETGGLEPETVPETTSAEPADPAS